MRFVSLAALVAAFFITGCAAPATTKVEPASTTILHIDPPAPKQSLGPLVGPPAHVFALALSHGLMAVQPPPVQDDRIHVRMPDGTTVHAPAGAGVSLGTARGAGIETASEEAVSKVDATAPSVDLGQMRSSGGRTKFKASLSGVEGLNAFHLFGGLFLAAAVAAFVWLKDRALAVGLGLVGGVLIGVGVLLAEVAWLLALIPVACFGVLIWLMVEKKSLLAARTALGKVARGIETLDESVAEKVKANVRKAAGNKATKVGRTVDREVDKAKAAEGV